jgi:hypothetical protein
MFVMLPPSVPIFSSKAGEPETVPVVTAEAPLAGIVTVRSLLIGGVSPCGVSGFFAFCRKFIETAPESGSRVTVAFGSPTVCTSAAPVNRLIDASAWPPGFETTRPLAGSVSTTTVIEVRDETACELVGPRLSAKYGKDEFQLGMYVRSWTVISCCPS